MSVIELVILTKSSKRGGFCVAGINLGTREWTRLVSENAENDGAITDDQMRDANGASIQPLDVVRVDIKKHSPIGCQSENYVVFSGRPWRRISRMNFNQVLSICSTIRSKHLFGNQYKYLNEEQISKFDHSLAIAEVTELKIYKNEFDKIKCSFTYNGNQYVDISMTDPDYYKNDSCEIGSSHIVVSLPHTDYEGRYYKFVAKIFHHTNSGLIQGDPFLSILLPNDQLPTMPYYPLHTGILEGIGYVQRFFDNNIPLARTFVDIGKHLLYSDRGIVLRASQNYIGFSKTDEKTYVYVCLKKDGYHIKFQHWDSMEAYDVDDLSRYLEECAKCRRHMQNHKDTIKLRPQS